MLLNYRYYTLLATTTIIAGLLTFSTSVAASSGSNRRSFSVDIGPGNFVFTPSNKDGSNYMISFITTTANSNAVYNGCNIEIYPGRNETCAPYKDQKPVCKTGKFNLAMRTSNGPAIKDSGNNNAVPTLDNSSGPSNGVPIDCDNLDSGKQQFTLKLNGFNKNGQGGNDKNVCVPIANPNSASRGAAGSGSIGLTIMIAVMVSLGLLFSSAF
ncbi:hypothetical protein H4219_003927 [Mycoemilia scoparia]|uniref:Uncharacterized protein n=1 Tax=Mycoemilia scoparia TaxID=417184 RepID=A0A9W7ZZ18_9FUNG|nr:hypothetical protein H4219_003927 [Mycoemilia scoparia]